MSLIANVYIGSPSEMESVEGEDFLAGPENWRTEVWGSDFARAAGLRMLSSLANGDIYAAPEHLSRLEEEVLFLKRNSTAIRAYTEERIVERCDNLLEAIQRARAIPGGCVVIW